MAQTPPKYPPTRQSDVGDDYFGTRVPDPYRWLEDDNAPETVAWVEAQNKVTFAFLETIPERKAIRDRLTKLWNYEKFSNPWRRGRRYFYTHNSGLQNQALLFVTEDLKRPGRLLLDPNALSKDGTVALSGLAVTEDGRHLAYSLSEAGSDWQTWKVRDVDTGKDLPDEIRWSKFSGASWLKDGSGFFYSRYDAPAAKDALTAVNRFQKLYFHKLGTSQAQDTLIYERKDQPDWGFSGEVSEDGRWLVITQWEGTEPKNRIFLKDLSRPGTAVEPFLEAFDAAYGIVDNEGETFFVRTDHEAPRYRLVAVQRNRPKPREWKVLIPQDPGGDVLEGVSLVGGRFVAQWMKDARSVVTFHRLDGQKSGDLALPGIGSATGFGGRREDSETFYTFQSFVHPPTVFRYDFKGGRSEVLRAPKVDSDPAAYDSRQVFYTSKDGTRIPMFIVHRKGIVLDGSHPTLLYGYGGFNISETPAFSPRILAWLEMGGVFALPNLRGGGEYGKSWHDAGRLDKKQNVFDDFIAAAQWLIENKVTCPSKLAINGGSNGGLLVGACMTQRPDLFGAAVPEVGVMDMLRYHRFTIGWAWKSDYLVSDTREGFLGLMKYSPLHNLRAGVAYPATLVTTGDHDDRVVPAHSHKFIATLQALQAGPAPVLTRIETKAGHGAGKPTDKQIAERADVLAFLVKVLGVKLPPSFHS
ncbi:MAG: S9 family peptidase [Acidobacteria bacterium]|nr:S9 family peptidase [Acidobacteriota bacterium]